MALELIKEDGTGKPDANTYADLDDASVYLEATGRRDTWLAAETSARRVALYNATQYMDARFRGRYLGERASATADTQALEFPREGLLAPSGNLIDPADIPAEVVNACIEYAFVALSGELTPDTSGRSVKRTRRTVGPITTETEFDGPVGAAGIRKFRRADRIIARWLRPSFGRTLRL